MDDRPLTARQHAVALLVADGWTDKQIAAELAISEETVGNHLRSIAERLVVDRSRNIRVQISRYFAQRRDVSTLGIRVVFAGGSAQK